MSLTYNVNKEAHEKCKKWIQETCGGPKLEKFIRVNCTKHLYNVPLVELTPLKLCYSGT